MCCRTLVSKVYFFLCASFISFPLKHLKCWLHTILYCWKHFASSDERVEALHFCRLGAHGNSSSTARCNTKTDWVQWHQFPATATTRVPPYVSKWLCGLLYQNGVGGHEWLPAHRSRNALLAQARGASRQWTGQSLWKSRKAVRQYIVRTVHCSVASPVYSRHYFCCLQKRSVDGMTSFFFFFFNRVCLLLVLSLLDMDEPVCRFRKLALTQESCHPFRASFIHCANCWKTCFVC